MSERIIQSFKLKTVHCMLKIYNNKMYNAYKDVIYINKLRCKQVEIAKNDILKNYGHAIHLFEVRCQGNDPLAV
jgi:hypothetical protein